MKKLSAVLLIFVLLIQTLFISAFAEDPFELRVNVLRRNYLNAFRIDLQAYYAESDAQIYTAVYKNNVLEHVFKDDYTAGEYAVYDTKYYETDDTDGLSEYSFKFFVWDNNFNPITTAYDPNNYEYGCVISASDANKKISILTDSGEIKNYSLTEDFKIMDGDEYDSFASYKLVFTKGIQGSYVRYTPENKTISTLYGLNDWGYTHYGTDIPFNKSTLSFGQNQIDEDSVVYLLSYNDDGTLNTDETRVGTVSDLSDKMLYTYIACTNGWSLSSGNRVIVSDIKNPSIDNGTISLITKVIKDTNVEGEDVYLLNYYTGSELIENAYTTAEVYNTTPGITAGDIVNFEITDSVITKINKRIDFSEPVRDKETGLISATTLANGESSFSDDDEEYTFGYATNYREMTTNVTLNEKTYRLDKAINVYYIDCNARNTIIDIGSYADFEYDEEITDNYDKYADWLFVRTKGDKITDLVIIKRIVNLR